MSRQFNTEETVKPNQAILNLYSQSIVAIENNNLNAFRSLYSNTRLTIVEPFFQSLYAQEIFKKALLKGITYIKPLLDADISALRVNIDGTSILDIFRADFEKYYDILVEIKTNEDDYNQLNETEKNALNTTLAYVEPHRFSNTQSLCLLTTNELAFCMFRQHHDVRLSDEETALLNRYIDPNLWPDSLALDAFLHQFFERLAERGFILTSTMPSTHPIEPKYLAQLASGEENDYITQITVEDDQIIPSLNPKKTDYSIMYALIPIQHNHHYGLLVIDLSQTIDGRYQIGKNNYFIEPYAIHIPLDSIHIRLATTLKLMNHEEEKFPISVINLSQTEIGSPCSDYVISIIMRILIEDENALKNLKKFTYLLTPEMIMTIRMMSSMTHGFEYFKLQLSTYVKNEPESTLIEAFNHLDAITSRFRSPPAGPVKKPDEIPLPKISFPAINMLQYNKYDHLADPKKPQMTHMNTSSVKRPETDLFKKPTERQSQQQRPHSLTQENTLGSTLEFNRSSQDSQQTLELHSLPSYPNQSFV